jgi:hypothetical protein
MQKFEIPTMAKLYYDMFKFTLVILLVTACFSVNSQNIYSALHLNEEREYKTRRPKVIVKTNTFYNKSSRQILREIESFDESGMFLNEERFDEDGSRTVRLTHINDTINRIVLASSFERWTKFGYSKELTSCEYDSTKFLVGIITKTDKGIIISRTEIKINEKGHPIEMIVFDGSGISFGKEIAKYFYETNKYVASVITNDGTLLNSDTNKISYKNAYLFPSEKELFNDHGDEIKWTSKNFNGTETNFEEEYTYDGFGNCTENRIFKLRYKVNGKIKRETDRIFKKEYTY